MIDGNDRLETLARFFRLWTLAWWQEAFSELYLRVVLPDLDVGHGKDLTDEHGWVRKK